MPFYDYYCAANKKTVEVLHPVGVRLKTWGEVCRKAGITPGKTPLKAKVTRLVIDVTPMIFRLKGMDADEPSKGPLRL